MFGLLGENRSGRQPGGKKGIRLSPRESKVGAGTSVNVPDGPIFPSPHKFREGGCPEACQKAISRWVFKKQIMTSGIQLQGLPSEIAVPGCIFLGRKHSILESVWFWQRTCNTEEQQSTWFACLRKVNTCILLYSLKTRALFLIPRPPPCQKHQSSTRG